MSVDYALDYKRPPYNAQDLKIQHPTSAGSTSPNEPRLLLAPLQSVLRESLNGYGELEGFNFDDRSSELVLIIAGSEHF